MNVTFKDETPPEPGTYYPRRDDAVAVWLRARRETFPQSTTSWQAVNSLLDEYREKADYGLPLSGDGGDP